MNESAPPLDAMDSADLTSPAFAASPRRIAGCVAAVAVVFVAAFWPDLRWLWTTWTTQPDYSHGFLIIPLALVILWRQFEVETEVEDSTRWQPVWLGWVGLALVLGLRAFFYHRGNSWAAAVMMLASLPCLTLALGGWELLRRTWPALAFLVFMYPLPGQLDALVSRPLRQLATTASVNLLKNLGFWVMAEGNVIHIGAHQLGVETACNGLAMLVCLAATVTAVVILMPLRPWQRLVLLLTVIPVALFCNILRIVATAWAFRDLGPERAEHLAHDVAGWLMMPLAIVLVGLEITALKWLVVEERSIEEPLILGNRVPQKRVETVPADEESPPLLGLPVPAGGERGDEHD